MDNMRFNGLTWEEYSLDRVMENLDYIAMAINKNNVDDVTYRRVMRRINAIKSLLLDIDVTGE